MLVAVVHGLAIGRRQIRKLFGFGHLMRKIQIRARPWLLGMCRRRPHHVNQWAHDLATETARWQPRCGQRRSTQSRTSTSTAPVLVMSVALPAIMFPASTPVGRTDSGSRSCAPRSDRGRPRAVLMWRRCRCCPAADLLHPIHDLALQTFLNCDMRHGRRG